MSTYTTCSSTLASCALIFRRISATLAQDCVLILHRSQWQCLAKSYSEVLQSLAHLLQHACPPLGQLKLLAPLRALLHSMQEAERCIEDCTARRPTLSHSWLLDNALKLGPSSDVVNLHLRDFLWSFSAVLNQAMAPQIDTVKSDLVQLTRALSEIWAFEDSEADLSEACNFLNTIKAEEEGEPSLLADFILQKLSHAQDLESGEAGVLPDYLWIDPSSLTRNPELLGVGTYGKVQEAGWLGGRFAVKDFFYVEENTTFGREAAIQARLRHPNVISLICCTQNPSLYKCSLVMELMQQDLRVLMIEKTKTGMAPPFSLDVAVDLMLQIAQGLEYLHSLHIMHRDLKSSNILVSFSRRTCDGDMDDVGPRAYLKIADFGMSKAKHGSSKFTTKQVGATPWRAPEVFEINPEDEVEGDTNGKYTNKADVYSFGLVCYEILTGEFPFDGTQIRKRVLAGERPSLPSYCPPALSSYIQRCWHAEPWKRPPFRQICRMLRYFKACILHLDHHDQSPAQYSWLLHPLSSDVCARIDNMVISFMQPIDTPLQPQPVNIPLEMHCSRVVLEGREETERASNEHANGVRGRRITQGGVESNESTDELQQNGHGHRKYSSKAKGYSIYVSRLLKNLFCIQAAQPTKEELQAALGLVRDFTIEELRLATADFQKVIGEGATGTVYYGKLEDGREIAVKVAVHPKLLRSGHIVSTSETTGLMQELRIASQLRHRNIVPLFGWCQDRGKLLLLYEFMPNGNLARHIFGKQNSLDWQLRYNVVSQLASALKYLHQDSGYLQIVHRDVKASNLLLDSLWNARLGDCGLAVLLRNGDAPLQSLAGTFGYIAPESVAQGRVSPASDVYAFGVTVLEIATGRRAHFKDEMGEIHYVRDWIWRMYQLGDLMEVADIRLGGKFDEVKMKRLLLLGLSCTSVDPSMRPPIEEVLNILSGASEPAPRAQTTQIYLSSGMDSSTFASTSTGSFWNRPTVEHMSFDNNEASGPLTPIREAELDQISNVRVFTFNELKLATRNFRPENLLGEGGFGSVHKGSIDEVGPTGAKITSGTTVAVKVLNPKGLQGHKEWLSEVMLLGQLHHPHLVKLIGCCCEDEHRLLVYKFMPRGSLDNHLYGKTTLSLSWTTRMKIALGAAEGLAFLHGLVKPILLRDFKTSNILLDSDYTAKLSDFGFAKHGPMDDETHVSTLVLGTYGYVAPEYVATGRLTWRSDIYSYGIVLLELLTGQKSVDKTRGMGKENLVEWVCPYLRDKRRWSQVMDPKLRGLYSLKKAQRAAHLALDCLSSDPKKRPLISNVVQTLESLQEREKDHMQQVHQGHTKQ